MSTEAVLSTAKLPAINRLLREPAVEPLVAQHGQTPIGELLRPGCRRGRAVFKRQ